MKPTNFSLKMAVEDMPEGGERKSHTVERFGVQWFLRAHRRNEDDLDVNLHCSRNENAEGPWSIDTTIEIRLVSAMREIKYQDRVDYVYKENIGHESTESMIWDDAIEDSTADKKAMIYCDVTINQMTGIAQKKLKSFEEPEEDLTDVILNVGEQKFHVSKRILADHSPYFAAKFENDPPEVELKDVDSDVFQQFLEVIYGQLTTAEYVSDLLEFADKFDAPSVRQRCEEFVLETNQIDKTEKLRLADVFTLEKLMTNCLESMKTLEDIEAFLPFNLAELSHPTLAVVLEKAL